MTPEQREKKNQGDRDRRARNKAALDALKAAKQLPLTPPPTVLEMAQAVAKSAGVTAPVAMVDAQPSRKPRGGARPGSGPKASGRARMQVCSFKGNPDQLQAFRDAGGGEWLRGVLDRRIKKG